MNTTPDRLTEILHKRADEKLRTEIEALIPLSYCNAWGTVSSDAAKRLLDQAPKETFWIPNLIRALREALISAKTEAARAAESGPDLRALLQVDTAPLPDVHRKILPQQHRGLRLMRAD